MFMFRWLAFFTIMAIAALGQAPRVAAVVNGASFAVSGLPNGAIAQGSIFTAFGERMGPAQLASVVTLPLPTTLSGTSIRITSGGVTRDAIMLFTSAGQIAAVLPSSTPAGNATMTLTYNGQTSAPFAFRVVEASFGSFAQNQRGSGPAVAFNFVAPGSEPLNILTRAANPNQVVTLYGTGLGPITGDETRPNAQAVARVPEVYVGGVRATVDYAGRSSCCVGLDQINFRVPANIDGCYVPVYVVTGGVASNFTTIAVSRPGQPCTATNGLTAGDLQNLTSNGSLRIGDITLSRLSIQVDPLLPTFSIESGTGSFARFPADLIFTDFSFNALSIGSCYVSTGEEDDPTGDDEASPLITYLNAGTLSITGPRGRREFNRSSENFYSQTFTDFTTLAQPPFLDPGSYTLEATGGPAVGAFRQTFNIGALLNWTNASAISTINRSQNLTINWTGGGPGSLTYIFGGNSVSQDGPQASFVCIERSERGTFSIPSAILSAVPPGGDSGSLLVGNFFDPIRITPTPSGLDTANINVISLSGKQVRFQ